MKFSIGHRLFAAVMLSFLVVGALAVELVRWKLSPLPVAGQEDAPEDKAAELAEGRRFNFGFETVGRLRCDIGYIVRTP